MCVIAKETGQSPWARTCSRTWVFLKRLHSRRSVSSASNRSRHKTTIQNNWRQSFTRDAFSRYVFQRKFTARPGARRFLYRMMQKLWLCVVSELIPDDKSVWHWCGVVSQQIRKMFVVWCGDSRCTGRCTWESWPTDGFNCRRQKLLSREVFSVTCYGQ